MSEEKRRRRELSEVDPLDATAYRTLTNNDHDFAGASMLPDDLHRTTSRASFRRRSSASRLTSPADEEANTTAMANKRPAERIEEAEEDDDNNEPYATDSYRRTSVSTLPLQSRTTTLNKPQTLREEDVEEEEDGGTMVKTTTTKSVKQKRNRATFRKIAWMFFKVYFVIFIAFIAILSIYWGSWFHRSTHLKGLSYLVVTEESTVGEIPPLFSETLTSMLNSSSAHAVGTFHFKSEEVIASAAKANRTVYEQVVREVHNQNYWGGFYVPANLTLDYFTALSSSDTSFNTTEHIKVVYETGRKPQSTQGYVVTPMISLQKSFSTLVASYITQPLVAKINSTQQVDLVNNASSLLSGPWFSFVDYRPATLTIIIGPVQIGLLYILVMSFHQFNFASALHESIRAQVRLRQYMVYHIITSHLAYLALSLVYILIAVAFGTPYDAAFGKSGFLVAWACTYLAIAAMGGINENAALWIFAWNRPYIGFWIVFFMVINLAPVFSPIEVMNVFFRYGYAMPMHACHELLKVCFLDTYQGNMGRYIGILIAWIVLANICLPFSLRGTKRYKLKVEERARVALEKAKEEKNQ